MAEYLREVLNQALFGGVWGGILFLLELESCHYIKFLLGLQKCFFYTEISLTLFMSKNLTKAEQDLLIETFNVKLK